MASSFFRPEKKEHKSLEESISISADRGLESFAENRLLARGLTSELTSQQPFLDELNLLFGNKLQQGEPKIIDYTRRRAVSCSLMVPDVPMSMFSKLGLLFDADASTIRFLSKTDAWTDFHESADGVLWGVIEADSGTQIISTHGSKKWLPPTVKDLAIHMQELYQNAKNPVDEKKTNKVILDHNEIKANLFKQGLLGIYAEFFNKSEYAKIFEPCSEHSYITNEYIETLTIPTKLFLLKLQAEIAEKHQVELPLFIWDCAQGKLNQWLPTPEEVADLDKQMRYIEKRIMLFDWIQSSSLEEFKKFLNSLSESNRHQFLHQYGYDLRGSTPLLHLIHANQPDKIHWLIKEFNIDVNQPSLWNEIPLVMAAFKNCACVEAIINASNFQNNLTSNEKQLDIAAREAAAAGNVEMVQWLIGKGAAAKGEGDIDLLVIAEDHKKTSEIKEDHHEVLNEVELLEKWRTCLCKLFGDEFELAEDKDNLFINPDSIEICFKNKPDSDKFKSFFHHPETIEEYGLYVVKLRDLSDQAIFFNCLETMKMPEPACLLKKRF